MPGSAHSDFDSPPGGNNETATGAKKWLAIGMLSPIGLWLLLFSPLVVRWARGHVAVSALIAAIAITLLAVLIAYRVRLWASIRRHMLHAAPTEHCRVCGYASAGLERTRIEHTTLPFDQARCPECGRPNPR